MLRHLAPNWTTRLRAPQRKETGVQGTHSQIRIAAGSNPSALSSRSTVLAMRAHQKFNSRNSSPEGQGIDMSKKSIDIERARVDRVIRNRVRLLAQKRFLKRIGLDPSSLRHQSVRAILQEG